MSPLPILAAFGIFQSPAPTAIFILCILVSSAILLFYAKRHPHPRFRPKLGELVLVGMLFFGVSVGLTAMTAGLFEQEILDEAGKKAKKRASQMGSGGGSSKPDDSDSEAGGEDIFKEEVPPFVEEE